jgi:hypothetical protein
MGRAVIRCHCGWKRKIYTYSRGEAGWYECDCGCAWSYQDVGRGEIILEKRQSCREFPSKALTVPRHYTSDYESSSLPIRIERIEDRRW